MKLNIIKNHMNERTIEYNNVKIARKTTPLS